MNGRPIESVMTCAMESIRDMIDVSTLVGEPIAGPNGSTVIPVTRASFGFASGGGDLPAGENAGESFAGGAGAGVSLRPVAFLVMDSSGVRVLPALFDSPADRLIELIPQAVAELRRYLTAKAQGREQAAAETKA